jgi:hypothetical protein
LSYFGLPIYSLPFNIVVILFIYVLKLRQRKHHFISETVVQYNSPEKNLYAFKNSINRFSKTYLYYPIKLPFWGEWMVSQGHNGKYTHKNDYCYAWDFVITNENNCQFADDGSRPEHYFVYKKNVLAPADGYVVDIIDNIPDNLIGEVNLKENWGNTIIIKHSEYLYSKLSHLKMNSFVVKKGDYVKQLQMLAQCGNSGRSPYPHLHFQLQTAPYIDSTTILYPISHYITKQEGKYQFNHYRNPEELQKVSNVQLNVLLKNAFNFIPGKKVSYKLSSKGTEQVYNWEIYTDSLNQTYIFCKKTNSVAYLFNDGTIHYFRTFEGDKKSALYYFVLALYKVQLGFYQNMEISDSLNLDLVFNRKTLLLQDFVAPFYMFMKAEYSVNYYYIDDYMHTSQVRIETSNKMKMFNKNIKQNHFSISITEKGVESIEMKIGKEKLNLFLVNE